ncbi:hypothetical protein LCGC14_0284130 [marine sediment metagenome]|uniref:quinolinate synthase n=1 Tax=marine sediment metagenome TaxID=412755 RepID=A0A0F9X0K1_9ZZZZ|nr:quinolinate synthase NadA [Phycisphaerae bacterium]HDZ43946.1 quinolinate synthase NadA [Phycisphaerae bacterium]
MFQPSVPEKYVRLSDDELAQRIAACKERLGGRVCILGHHYQRDPVIQFADFTGDSLKLSQQAADQDEAEFIVFCGVHFMAESADILSSDRQTVCLPNIQAGCAMADMADASAVTAALEELAELTDAKVVPITYVNSSAADKAITARADGACCTSSNVRNVFQWALQPAGGGGAGADKILAIPDEHLGRNTAAALGFEEKACAVYDPHLPQGGLSAADVEAATFILWKGYCHVHQVFTVEQVDRVRADRPDIRVIVHSECTREVVAAADASGSTSQIIQAISEAQPGSQWAVGTEANLVNRLAQRHTDRFIRLLSDRPATCWQMGKIDLLHLLWVLDGLVAGEIINPVTVPADIAADARIALQRMLDIKAATGLTQ